MALFTIDSDKCTGDGLCVSECPGHLIKMRPGDTVPTAIRGAEGYCIDCGHCVAVCPTGALAHRALSPEQCPPVRKDWLPDPERVENFLRARRSIRTYQNRPVQRELLTRVVDVARYAPSGQNAQSVGWLIIHDHDKVRRLTEATIGFLRSLPETDPAMAKRLSVPGLLALWDRGEDVICRGAPHIIIVHDVRNAFFARTDCTIATTYLDLAAPSFGLATCWFGYIMLATNKWPAAQSVLGLPEDRLCYAAMGIGYPEYEYSRLPSRHPAQITWL